MLKNDGVAVPTPFRVTRMRKPGDHDPLTGLLCGGALEAELDTLLQAQVVNAAMAGIIVLGIDRFRYLNDLLGYGAGDNALKEVAARISGWAGKSAIAGRLGGDEFAVLLPGASENKAMRAATQVLALFEKPVSIESREIYLCASVGVSLFPADGATASTLLRRASHGMGRVKTRGGSGIERFTLQSGLRPEERYVLESALRHAVDRNELSLRYQPQVDRDGRISGLEALLTWDHPELGRVEPSVFIRVAEETGVIIAIGEWVIEQACRQIQAWSEGGIHPPRVAVNVSPVQFSSPDFVPMVRRILCEHSLKGGCLELEITESAILRDLEESAALMAELRALGARIAIDDFGIGYSPLSYLPKLPLDTVKVDRTFIGQITKPSGSLPVVHTITVLAHQRGLQVVAEGVETPEELELARAARCDYVQGFLFGIPMSADEIAGVLRDPDKVFSPFGRSDASKSYY